MASAWPTFLWHVVEICFVKGVLRATSHCREFFRCLRSLQVGVKQVDGVAPQDHVEVVFAANLRNFLEQLRNRAQTEWGGKTFETSAPSQWTCPMCTVVNVTVSCIALVSVGHAAVFLMVDYCS